MPADFIPDEPQDFIPDAPDFIPDTPRPRAAAAPPSPFDDGPIRVRSGNLGSSGAPAALPGAAPTIGAVVSQIQLPKVYHDVLAGAHIPAALLDSVVGGLTRGPSRESLRMELVQAEETLKGIAPNDKGDRGALEAQILRLRDQLDNPASGIPETHAGATGELVRKASVLSPIAIPGHLARGAAALDLPGGKFAKAALEGGEKAGSELIADPATYLIPGHAGVAAMFLPQVAESLGTSVGELQAELDKNGWKLTPELGAKLGQTAVGAGFAAMLAHGITEGVSTGGKDQTAAVQKAHEELAPTIAHLEGAGISPPEGAVELPKRALALEAKPVDSPNLNALIPKELKTTPALDDLSFLPETAQAKSWDYLKQSARDFEAALQDPTSAQLGGLDGMREFIQAQVKKFPEKYRPQMAEKLEGLIQGREKGEAFRQDIQEYRDGAVAKGRQPWEVIQDPKTGAQVEMWSADGSLDHATFLTIGEDGKTVTSGVTAHKRHVWRDAADKTKSYVDEGHEIASFVGGGRYMDLPDYTLASGEKSSGAGPVMRAARAKGVKHSELTTTMGTEHQQRAAAKGLDLGGAREEIVGSGTRPATEARAEVQEPGTALEGAPDRGARVPGSGRELREPGAAGSNAAVGAGAGAEFIPDDAAALAADARPDAPREITVGQPPPPEGLPGGSEAGALLTKTPDQPVAPIPGYDSILAQREAAGTKPGIFRRLRDFFDPTNIKEKFHSEDARVFAAADKLQQAMGMPGPFDSELSPIPKDPRIMLPLARTTAALVHADTTLLDHLRVTARTEGLLGGVTQLADILGGKRRVVEGQKQLRGLERQSLQHEIGKRMKRPVSNALGQESRAFTALGDPQLGGEARVRKSGTLEEARYQIGERLAKLKSDTRATPGLEKVLAGKFVKARKQAAALKAKLYGKEVHPLFSSAADADFAITQMEEFYGPEKMARIRELTQHLIDLHKRNLDLAYRPTDRFGGSANALLTHEQYAELQSRSEGPNGTDYLPLNRVLDQIENKAGWQRGAGLTSSQRAWLQRYKKGSKNAPVDPFDAALSASARLFSDLTHNAAADSVWTMGLEAKRQGLDLGIRRLKSGEKARPNEIKLGVRKHGQLIEFAAPAEFGPALLAKTAPEMSGMLAKTLQASKSLLYKGVILFNPGFALTNVPVDFLGTQLLARVHTEKLSKYNPVKYAVGAAHWTAALKGVLRQDSSYMEALWAGALGGSMSHAIRSGRGKVAFPSDPKGVGGAIGDVLQRVGQATEETTKVYGYHEALRRLRAKEAKGQKFANPIELIAAHEALTNVGTPNVMQHGTLISEANVLMPFLNVGIQGSTRMWKRFKTNPKEFLIPTLMTVTAVEAGLLAWNSKQPSNDPNGPKDEREWDHVPQDEKTNYWIMLLPEEMAGRNEKGRLYKVKIRKPQEVRVFAGPISDVMWGAFTNANPDYAQSGIDAITEGQPIPGFHVDKRKPVGSAATSLGAALNPIVKWVAEELKNMDFLRGTPIETRHEQQQKPSERYNERTSPTAVVASQGIAQMAALIDRYRGGMVNDQGEPIEQLQDLVPSPKRIEHTVRTLTGGLGQMGMSVTDLAAREVSPQAQPTRPIENVPVLSALLNRIVTLNPRDATLEKLTDSFYDRFDQLDGIVKTYPVLAKSNPEQAQKFLQRYGVSEFGQARGEYVAMVNASQALARMYKEARAAKTSVEAKAINDRINQLLRTVVAERKRRGSASTTTPSSPTSPPPLPSPSTQIDVADEDFVAPRP